MLRIIVIIGLIKMNLLIVLYLKTDHAMFICEVGMRKLNNRRLKYVKVNDASVC